MLRRGLSGTRRRVASFALILLCSCSNRLDLGSDLLWSADHESGDLQQWASAAEEDPLRLPSEDASVEITTEQRRSGNHAIELVNPAAWDNEDAGPELLRTAGALADAYYSAWFYLPEDYRMDTSLTLLHLRSREPEGEVLNGEQLQLRSLPGGGYVLQVFHNHSSFLAEPVAEPAPHVAARRWFQIEARYEPHSAGRLRVWLDGALSYDLSGRPGAAASEVVLSVSNVVERAEPAPLTLFVDDVAISLSRVGPEGQLTLD